MKEETIIEQEFKKLPERVQEAVAKVNLLEKLSAIGVKFKLQIDELGALEHEIAIMILGLEKSEQFIENIKEHVGVTMEVAIEIAQEINLTIFKAIQEEMRKQEESGEEDHSMIDHATLLNEIENPTPAPTPIRTETPSTPPTLEKPIETTLTPQTPATVDEKALLDTTHTLTIPEQVTNPVPVAIPQPVPTPIVEQTPVSMPVPPQGVIEDKFAGMTKSTIQKETITDVKPSINKVDPYREPTL